MGIKDIANKAKVSQTTVSLALNGHKGVGTETRNRILMIAEEMGYRVPAQRSYAYPSEGVIIFAKVHKHGLILNKDQNIFILDYIDGLNPVIKDAGFTFEIMDQRVDNMKSFIDSINERNPEGLIFLGTEHDDIDIALLSLLKVPYLVMDAYYDFLDTQFIDMNNSQGVYEIIQYLINKGHENITMISSKQLTSNLKMREDYFISFMKKFNLNSSEQVYSVTPGFEGAYQDIKTWIDNRTILPDALFCYNDVAAYGVIKALKEKGIRVPEDISIIGFDDLPMSSMIEPHLTTIKVPNKQIGHIAGRSIVEKINAEESGNETATLANVELIERNSVINKLKNNE